MEERFAGNAYRHFLVWGIFTALTVTLCTIIDSLFIGNLIGSHGLAVTSLSTPVFLFFSFSISPFSKKFFNPAGSSG